MNVDLRMVPRKLRILALTGGPRKNNSRADTADCSAKGRTFGEFHIYIYIYLDGILLVLS